MYDVKLFEELLRDEGFRTNSYLDTKNNWTIGVGHLLGKSSEYRNIAWPPEKVVLTFIEDINASIFYVKKYIKNFDSLSPARQRVLISMMFNMGPGSFSGFKRMIAAINQYNYYKAYEEMLDSEWAKVDVPVRAKRTAEQWLEG